MDLGPAREPELANLGTRPEVTWIEPVPDGRVVAGDGDPAEVAVARETIRLAFVAALQHLPPRQRAVLILCEVLRWQAAEVAELLEHERRLGQQRAPARARDARRARAPAAAAPTPLDEADRELLARYVEAFERYDMDALTALIHEDATQSMPPYDLWLSGRDDILAWWVGPGRRLSRIARDRHDGGERRAGLRAVQAQPERGGLRAVGAPGARGRGRPDRRAHVLPRHGDACSRSSACPPGSMRSGEPAPVRSVRKDVAQPHEGEQVA